MANAVQNNTLYNSTTITQDNKFESDSKTFNIKKVEDIAKKHDIQSGPAGTTVPVSVSRSAIPACNDPKPFETVAKEAISPDITFSELLTIVNCADFQKNPNKEQLIKLFQKKFKESSKPNELPPSIQELYECLLKRSQSCDTIFRTLELVMEVNNFNEIFCIEYFKINFIILIFYNTDYALIFLNKYRAQFKEVDFKGVFEGMMARFGKIGISPEKDLALASCFKILSENKSITFNSCLEGTIYSLIRIDAPQTIKTIFDIINQSTSKPGIEFYTNVFSEMLYWDSVGCFKQLFKSNFYVFEISHLMAAAGFNGENAPLKDQAPKCLGYLVATYGIPSKLRKVLQEKAAESGNIKTLLALCQNDKNEAARLIFTKIFALLNRSANENLIDLELNELFYKLIRLNSINLVDRLVEIVIDQNKDHKDFILLTYEKVKLEFFKSGLFITRHKKPSQLADIQSIYSSTTKSDSLFEEKEYSNYCKDQVMTLFKSLCYNQINEPTDNSEFARLPPSSTNTRRFAAVVQKIGEKRSLKQAMRSGKHANLSDNSNLFKILKSSLEGRTPLTDRYSWPIPILSSIYHCSISPDFERIFLEDHDHFKECGKIKEQLMGYRLKFKNLTLSMNTVQKNLCCGKQYWLHGRSPLTTTLQNIEDLFETLMAFNLKKASSDNPIELKNYRKRLNEFYALAAELVWLIGNTTVLARGTGTVAEWILAIVHLQNGLKPPVLKTDYPQLDVLDISFPLSDYKDFFTFFFEPQSLPDDIVWPDLSNRSSAEQIEILYKMKEAGQLPNARIKVD